MGKDCYSGTVLKQTGTWEAGFTCSLERNIDTELDYHTIEELRQHPQLRHIHYYQQRLAPLAC